MLNEPETAPIGQTFTPRQLRILKASVIIMGVLLVLGFGLLLIGIYLQAAKIGKTPASSTAASSPPAPGQAPTIAVPAAAGSPTLPIAIEPGTELREVLADQGRLILHLKRESGSEIAIIDLATGRETQRITIAPRR